jgi:hypothetical protein
LWSSSNLVSANFFSIAASAASLTKKRKHMHYKRKA